jgi:MFS family permease
VIGCLRHRVCHRVQAAIPHVGERASARLVALVNFERVRLGPYAFGIYNAIKGAGYIGAPAAGGVLAATRGFAAIFVASAGVAVIALLLSLSLPGDTRGTLEDDEEGASFGDMLRIFAYLRLAPIYGAIVVNMFLVGVVFGFLPVYLHGIGYTTAASGIVLSVATASYLLMQPIAGVLADRFDPRLTVISGLLIAALGIVLTTFASGPLLIGVVVLTGGGVGTVWTHSDALVSASVADNRLGAGIGAAQSFKEFGDIVGPLVVGALTQFFGVRVGFVTCGTVGVLLVPLLVHSFKRGNIAAA